MSRIRTFVAVEVSSETRARAALLIERLQASQAQASWTRPENIHLSLKFLGDVEDRDIPDVCRAVARAVDQTGPMSLDIRGLGAFPGMERPRTVWLGVGEGPGRDWIVALQKRVEAELFEITDTTQREAPQVKF